VHFACLHYHMSHSLLYTSLLIISFSAFWKLQDITVRKLYKEVRSDLRKSWGFTNAIQLSIGKSTLVKDDRKIRDVGIHDNITLAVIAFSVPDKWDVFVTVPGKSAPEKITLEEVL